MELGVQLYGIFAGSQLAPSELFNMIARAGYTLVEPCIALEQTPGWEHVLWPVEGYAEKAREMASNGLKAVSCHVFAHDLSARADTMIQLASDTGMRHFVTKCPKDLSEESLQQAASQLTAAAKRLSEAGAVLLLHNERPDSGLMIHDMSAYEYLLSLCEGNVGAQVDVGWLLAAGVDPMTFLEKNASRVKLLHYKDFCMKGATAQEVSVGLGAVDLAACKAFAERRRLTCFVDQDSFAGDMAKELAEVYKRISG